jgi:hypothetical protein
MRRYTFPALLVILSVVPASGHTETIHGTTTLLSTYIEAYGYGSDDGFDFATQSIMSWTTSADSDLSFSLDVFDENPAIALKNCLGTVADVSLEALAEAPEEMAPLGGLNVQLNQTTVVKTADNIYVKFAARSLPGYYIEIEYYVQNDGSRSFGPLLAVEPTTWGRVKALYR